MRGCRETVARLPIDLGNREGRGLGPEQREAGAERASDPSN